MFINTLSESKSRTFKECHYKYKLRYINKLYPKSKNMSALNFGSFIHKILEDGVGATSVDQLTTIAESVRKDYPFSETYNPKIEKCLKNFLRFNSSLSEEGLTEMKYEVVVDEEKDLKLNGIIDRVIRGSEGGCLIIDYKTSKRELKALDLYQDAQLQGYCYAIHKLLNIPIKDITVAHYYPISNNFVTCSYSPSQIQTYLKKKVDQMWQIRKMKSCEFKPMENQFCNWCEFKSCCTLFTPGIIAEKNLEEMKANRTPRKKL